MALREGPAGPEGSYPEKLIVRQREVATRHSMRRSGLALAGLGAGAALLWQLAKKR